MDVEVKLWRERPPSDQPTPDPDLVVRATAISMQAAFDIALVQADFDPTWYHAMSLISTPARVRVCRSP